ncbi:hypothetical protein D8674_015806 [Pyrus ussuriensis x Pyrus communis]|uniref:Uncharacterized protein n=1 Tax=Pyrus ussuriensis x Pyrus communis TaxID=2448454 RepID=A0A5N5H817_9ROSA|nr:hypothetical protein D8674_015806 [Pyrus ussuriensis x Pyrus communis]
MDRGMNRARKPEQASPACAGKGARGRGPVGVANPRTRRPRDARLTSGDARLTRVGSVLCVSCFYESDSGEELGQKRFHNRSIPDSELFSLLVILSLVEIVLELSIQREEANAIAGSDSARGGAEVDDFAESY